MIDKEFQRLMRTCTSCQIAVAWASAKNFGAFTLLKQHRAKIQRMVVGTHFYQTHPDFIAEFRKAKGVRFVMPHQTKGVFHPKLYLFDMQDGTSACIAGSPNFTVGGFRNNEEVAVLFESGDDGAEESISQIRELIQSYWQENAKPIKKKDLEAYRAAWQRKQHHLKQLQGSAASHNAKTAEGSVLSMSWKEFFATVEAEQPVHNMKERLTVLETAHNLFSTDDHFADISPTDRLGIAGLEESAGVRWHWFGHMRGKIWKAVKQPELLKHLSAALDLIPSEGEIGRETYLAYIRRYKRAFPEGGAGIGGATRLLSMKRPDTFIGICNGNRHKLCDDFNINPPLIWTSRHRNTVYWDSVIEPIMASPWWNHPHPKDGVQRRVWDTRAAFLDAHFFERQTE